MIALYASLASAVVALVAGGYLGYHYGRSVEAKAQALVAQAQAVVAKIQK